MAAFFYFRTMKINSALSYYNRLISGELIFDIDEGFDNYTVQWWNNPEYDSMDFSETGNIFKSYMKVVSRRQASQVKKALIEEYEIAVNKEYFANQCEQKIQIAANELIDKYKSHPCFAEDLLEIFTDFKHNYLIPFLDDSLPKNIQKNHVNKVKWLGKINVLTTLFYDMVNGQDKAMPLIDASLDDIENLILNNFLDADGKELSTDTIKTNLRHDKQDKKAKIGYRIELGNVKPKV